MKPSIAIIGAGLAGLTLANQLKDLAHVTLFEKSRGIGGRLATRRAMPYQFDHGAQFFTARTSAFKAFIAPLLTAGIIDRWQGRFVEFAGTTPVREKTWETAPSHYVGIPSMNALAKYIGQSCTIEKNCLVKAIVREGSNWQLYDDKDQSLGQFNWVITACPPAQAAAILPADCQFSTDLNNKSMTGCYSLMLGFEDALDLGFDAALVRERDISWISVNSSKPGRAPDYCLLVHATNRWADEHMDADDADVKAHLLAEVSAVTDHPMANAQHIGLHRWRYANIARQAGPDFYIDEKAQLAACGDWCIQGRVEGAFLSGLRLSDYYLSIQ